MRLHPISRVAISCMLAGSSQLGCEGSCDPNVPYGQVGSCALSSVAEGSAYGACKDGHTTSLCDKDLACVDGTCLPCGAGEGEPCCQQPGGANTCNAGYACDSSTNVDWPTCTASCGLLGIACCPDNACPGVDG